MKFQFPLYINSNFRSRLCILPGKKFFPVVYKTTPISVFVLLSTIADHYYSPGVTKKKDLKQEKNTLAKVLYKFTINPAGSLIIK